MIHPLNKLGLTDVRDYVCAPDQPCLLSLNPKGFDSPRALAFRLDRPSRTAGVNESNIYTKPELKNYTAGAPYHSAPFTATSGYTKWTAFPIPDRGRSINEMYNINNGQTQYYVDSSLQPPFFPPVFNMPSRTDLIDYVDPMGSWKPQYDLKIIYPERYSCLSFLNDTSFQREDITALQQTVRNQQRSEPFFNL